MLFNELQTPERSPEQALGSRLAAIVKPTPKRKRRKAKRGVTVDNLTPEVQSTSKRIFIFLDGITAAIVGVSQLRLRESIHRIMKGLQPSLEMEQQ